jgi:hypothetical protein
MMRRTKAMVGLAGVASALLAVAAGSASAHEFVANGFDKTLPLKTTGVGTGTQAFKFGKIEFECNVARTKGIVSESPSPVLKVAAKYSECESHTKFFGQTTFPKIHFKKPVEYLYHQNGFAEVGAGGELASPQIGSEPIEIVIAQTGGCKVLWPAQTVPFKAEVKPNEEYSAVLFSNNEVSAVNLRKFPSGFQQKLVITNQLKTMSYEIEPVGLCEGWEKTEGKIGNDTGGLEVEVPGGNLGFV